VFFDFWCLCFLRSGRLNALNYQNQPPEVVALVERDNSRRGIYCRCGKWRTITQNDEKEDAKETYHTYTLSQVSKTKKKHTHTTNNQKYNNNNKHTQTKGVPKIPQSTRSNHHTHTQTQNRNKNPKRNTSKQQKNKLVLKSVERTRSVAGRVELFFKLFVSTNHWFQLRLTFRSVKHDFFTFECGPPIALHANIRRPHTRTTPLGAERRANAVG
jgi:hypothetical protein